MVAVEELAGRTAFAKRLVRARTRRQRGATLIEIATVLAIVALVIAGVLAIYTNAETSRKTSEALGQVANIQQAVRSLYGGQATFTGLNASALISSNHVPQKMVAGTTLRHAFNGPITIAPANPGGVTDGGFQVSFGQVPREACIKFLTSDLGRAVFSVGTGTAVKSLDGSNPPPFNPTEATTACSANLNTVTWVFI